MIKIAIVEDEDAQAEALEKCLYRFGKESNQQLSCVRYKDANLFLNEKKQVFDIVFMDIVMPGINGMAAAERMRRTNFQTILIFVTNMLNYAVKSYEVDALDYIVKPFTYERVVQKLRKVVRAFDKNRGKLLTVHDSGSLVQISSSEVYYVEIMEHRLVYHTMKGRFSELKPMKKLEAELKEFDFSRCNACYLINLKFILRVDGLYITMVNGDNLKISQPKRKTFMDDLANYLGQGG